MSRDPHDDKLFAGLLVEAWRADTASAPELAAGYRRFLRGRKKRRLAPRAATWLLVGALLGVGLAQAASGLSSRGFRSQQSMVALPSVAPGAAPRAPAAASVPTASLSSSIAPPEPSAARPVPRGPRPSTTASTLSAAPSASAPAYVRELWQQVAGALRSGDFTRAESALLEVERSADGSERDAARLSRAQLLSSHGQLAQALALAVQLETSARSNLIRDQARELRARLFEKDLSGRSTESGTGVKQP